LAGKTSQSANSIILNASGNDLTAAQSGFFVNPIRNNVSSNLLYYDSGTKEITVSPIGTQGQVLVVDNNLPRWSTFDTTKITTVESSTAPASASSLYLVMTDGAGSGKIPYVDATGTLLSYAPSTGTLSSTIFNATSDYRIKENIKILDNLFTLDKLRPITYTNKITKKQDIGFIAHEVQELFPYLVMGEKDGERMQSLNYNGLIGVLVKEIQELKKRVSELESK